jgi:hypothetical protein
LLDDEAGSPSSRVVPLLPPHEGFTTPRYPSSTPRSSRASSTTSPWATPRSNASNSRVPVGSSAGCVEPSPRVDLTVKGSPRRTRQSSPRHRGAKSPKRRTDEIECHLKNEISLRGLSPARSRQVAVKDATPRLDRSKPATTCNFFLAQQQPACGNGWIYMADDVLNWVRGREKVRLDEEATAAAIAEAQEQARLSAAADPVVKAVEEGTLDLLFGEAWSDVEFWSKAFLEINSAKQAKHVAEVQAKRAKQEAAQAEEDARTARRAELAKKKERERKQRDARDKAALGKPVAMPW